MNLYVPAELHAELTALANGGERPLTREIVIALREYVARQKATARDARLAQVRIELGQVGRAWDAAEDGSEQAAKLAERERLLIAEQAALEAEQEERGGGAWRSVA